MQRIQPILKLTAGEQTVVEQSDSADVAAMDARIAGVGDWRDKTLARTREVIREALPGVGETVKRKKLSNPAGVPVWERPGSILCTADASKDKVKITFGRGAMLADPLRLFNASLSGNAMRAIDLAEGEVVEPTAFKALVQADAADQAAQRQK